MNEDEVAAPSPRVSEAGTLRIVPMLPVLSMPAAVAFYERLGFRVEHRNDSWGWATLRAGEGRLMVDESTCGHPSGPRDSVLYLYPQDVRALHRRLRDAGVLVSDLDVTFYGMTEFRLEDPDGNRLWIGQPTTAEPRDAREPAAS